jgi:hypothetical protein
VKNKPALIQEVATWIDKNGGGRGPDFRIEKISALEVTGNSATATAQTARGKRPIDFQRGISGWLISLPDRKLTGQSNAHFASDEQAARKPACTYSRICLTTAGLLQHFRAPPAWD